MASDPPARVVLTTAPDAQVADRLARTLVEERLVACVNCIAGVRSVYRWQDQIEEAGEVLLVMKTRSDRLRALEARVRELHPYDVPELVSLPVSEVSQPYLEWILKECAA